MSARCDVELTVEGLTNVSRNQARRRDDHGCVEVYEGNHALP
jgi:hypothetical protein